MKLNTDYELIGGIAVIIFLILHFAPAFSKEPNMSYEQQLFERKLDDAEVKPALLKKIVGLPLIFVPPELLGDSMCWNGSFIVVGDDWEQARLYNVKTGIHELIYDLREKE